MRSGEIFATGLLFAEAAGAVMGGVPGNAHAQTTAHEQQAPRAQVAFYEGVLPSELAVQSLHERLGLTITTASEDDNGLCPAPGHPDQGDVTYLGPNDTDPVCTNDSLLAKPWDNPYVCPNNTVHAGTVYDTTDPAGYAQRGKTIKPTPTPQPAATRSAPPR